MKQYWRLCGKPSDKWRSMLITVEVVVFLQSLLQFITWGWRRELHFLLELTCSEICIHSRHASSSSCCHRFADAFACLNHKVWSWLINLVWRFARMMPNHRPTLAAQKGYWTQPRPDKISSSPLSCPLLKTPWAVQYLHAVCWKGSQIALKRTAKGQGQYDDFLKTSQGEFNFL